MTAGYVGEYCPSLVQIRHWCRAIVVLFAGQHFNPWAPCTDLVVVINVRYPPSLRRTLLTDSLPCKLSPRVIQLPTIQLLLLSVIAESQQLIQTPQLTRALSYRVVHLSSLFVCKELERHECEIATSYAYGGWLMGCGRRRCVETVVDHGICDPCFARLLLGIWCCGRGLAFFVGRGVAVYHVVCLVSLSIVLLCACT